jgi:hypothetical protein
VKITNILAQQVNQHDTSKTTKGSKSDFADLLRNAESQSKASDATAVSNAQELLAVSSIGNIIAAGRQNLEAALSHTLDLLDGYSEALADSDRSLEELEPMVRELEGQAESLSQISEKSSDNPDLQHLADQTAILAMVEAAKFKRGDYT